MVWFCKKVIASLLIVSFFAMDVAKAMEPQPNSRSTVGPRLPISSNDRDDSSSSPLLAPTNGNGAGRHRQSSRDVPLGLPGISLQDLSAVPPTPSAALAPLGGAAAAVAAAGGASSLALREGMGAASQPIHVQPPVQQRQIRRTPSPNSPVSNPSPPNGAPMSGAAVSTSGSSQGSAGGSGNNSGNNSGPSTPERHSPTHGAAGSGRVGIGPESAAHTPPSDDPGAKGSGGSGNHTPPDQKGSPPRLGLDTVPFADLATPSAGRAFVMSAVDRNGVGKGAVVASLSPGSAGFGGAVRVSIFDPSALSPHSGLPKDEGDFHEEGAAKDEVDRPGDPLALGQSQPQLRKRLLAGPRSDEGGAAQTSADPKVQHATLLCHLNSQIEGRLTPKQKKWGAVGAVVVGFGGAWPPSPVYETGLFSLGLIGTSPGNAALAFGITSTSALDMVPRNGEFLVKAAGSTHAVVQIPRSEEHQKYLKYLKAFIWGGSISAVAIPLKLFFATEVERMNFVMKDASDKMATLKELAPFIAFVGFTTVPYMLDFIFFNAFPLLQRVVPAFDEWHYQADRAKKLIPSAEKREERDRQELITLLQTAVQAVPFVPEAEVENLADLLFDNQHAFGAPLPRGADGAAQDFGDVDYLQEGTVLSNKELAALEAQGYLLDTDRSPLKKSWYHSLGCCSRYTRGGGVLDSDERQKYVTWELKKRQVEQENVCLQKGHQIIAADLEVFKQFGYSELPEVGEALTEAKRLKIIGWVIEQETAKYRLMNLAVFAHRHINPLKEVLEAEERIFNEKDALAQKTSAAIAAFSFVAKAPIFYLIMDNLFGLILGEGKLRMASKLFSALFGAGLGNTVVSANEYTGGRNYALKLLGGRNPDEDQGHPRARTAVTILTQLIGVGFSLPMTVLGATLTHGWSLGIRLPILLFLAAPEGFRKGWAFRWFNNLVSIGARALKTADSKVDRIRGSYRYLDQDVVRFLNAGDVAELSKLMKSDLEQPVVVQPQPKARAFVPSKPPAALPTSAASAAAVGALAIPAPEPAERGHDVDDWKQGGEAESDPSKALVSVPLQLNDAANDGSAGAAQATQEPKAAGTLAVGTPAGERDEDLIDTQRIAEKKSHPLSTGQKVFTYTTLAMYFIGMLCCLYFWVVPQVDSFIANQDQASNNATAPGNSTNLASPLKGFSYN